MYERGNYVMSKIKNFIGKIRLEAVAPATIVRFIVLIIAIALWILKMFGIIPSRINNNIIFNIIIIVFGVFVFLYVYWKNNSWTEPALVADEIMNFKKEKLKGVDWNERC